MAAALAETAGAPPSGPGASLVDHHGCVSRAALADFQGALLDTMACTLQARSVPDVRGVARACAGGGSVPVWWTTAAGDPVGAAFANAYATHRLERDSFHPATLGHPAAVTLRADRAPRLP
jgi:2-methylcitrate dehydratase PrpD